MTTPTPAPPRLARWILCRALEGATRSAIVGDLDEEFARYAVPDLGVRGARRWYWRQALTSVVSCVRHRVDRGVHADDGPDDHTVVRRALMTDVQGWSSDIRMALRFALRRPRLAAIVIATLALGIAANTAVFSVFNATFLKPLPIAHPDRLVTIEPKEGGPYTYPEYLTIRNAAGFDALFAGGRIVTILDDAGSRERVVVDVVSGNFFDALGVAGGGRGRLFQQADDDPGKPAIVVLSDAFWARRFNRDRSVIGRSVKLHRAFCTIAGIAPAGFAGAHAGFAPDMWMPLTQAPAIDANAEMLGERSPWLSLGGVLRDPSSLMAARASVSASLGDRGAGEQTVTLTPRGEDWFDEGRTVGLPMLSLFVVVILVIACLNVSTLLGAGVHERQRELAVRSMLGAGRVRLLRQLLVEHIALASAAGVIGGALGSSGARWLAPLMASRFTPGDLYVSADVRVILFTVAVSVLSGLCVGLVPAYRWSRVSNLVALSTAGGGGMGRPFRGAGLWWLIPWQVALGTVLLASAGLFAQTIHRLRLEIQAAAPERVWFAHVELDESMIGSGAASVRETTDRLRTHVQSLAGIESVAMGTLRPLSTLARGPIFVQGLAVVPNSRPMPWGPPPPPPPRGAISLPEKLWIVSHSFVTPGFFHSLGLPMVEGRDFDDRDAAGAPHVAIVNQTFASRAFGKASALGRRLSFARPDKFDIEVVGVVRDLRYEHLREAAPDGIFFPLGQIPRDELDTPLVAGPPLPIGLTLTLRAREGRRLAPDELRRQVLAFDSRLLVDRIWTFDEEAGRALSQERLLAGFGTALGGVALVLLIIGLYGTLTAAVARSRRELGIRLALGAAPRALSVMVVGRSLVVVSAGLALGLPLSYLATKYLAHLLYGVSPAEPLVAAGIVLTLLATAAVSAYLPARQAANVDPVVALRAE